jgi:hypothetical protein
VKKRNSLCYNLTTLLQIDTLHIQVCVCVCVGGGVGGGGGGHINNAFPVCVTLMPRCNETWERIPIGFV